MIGDTTTTATPSTTGSLTDWLTGAINNIGTALGTDAQAFATAYTNKVAASGTPQPTYNILPSATSLTSGMSNYAPYIAIGLVAFLLLKKRR